MKKVLVLSVVFYELDVIKKHVESLIPIADEIDLVLLENRSIHTEDKIAPFCMELLESKVIKRYALFEDNIGGSVFLSYINKNREEIDQYNYIVITDGDLTVNATEWLKESLFILDKVPRAFSCAVNLDDSNLPLNAFPDAYSWIPSPIYHDFCLEAPTGLHMLMLPKANLLGYVDWVNENNLVFVDGTLRNYCGDQKLKWLKTLTEKGYHLTWDLYQDLEHPYTKYKLEEGLEVFKTNKECRFTTYSKLERLVND